MHGQAVNLLSVITPQVGNTLPTKNSISMCDEKRNTCTLRAAYVCRRLGTQDRFSGEAHNQACYMLSNVIAVKVKKCLQLIFFIQALRRHQGTNTRKDTSKESSFVYSCTCFKSDYQVLCLVFVVQSTRDFDIIHLVSPV